MLSSSALLERALELRKQELLSAEFSAHIIFYKNITGEMGS